MSTAVMESVEQDILEKIQEGIPLEARPFKIMSEELGLSEEDLIDKIKSLKEQKIIRIISPIYVTKMLDYDSSLVAFQVAPENLEAAAEIINQHPGVSHNYQRDHEFNLWFTLAVPPDSSLGLEKSIDLLAAEIKPSKQAILRSTKVFKIGVKLHMKKPGKKSPGREHIKQETEKQVEALTDLEKAIIGASQADIPLVSEPFKAAIQSLNISEELFFDTLKSFKERGIIRRFAALLYHRKAGFSANGMSVWEVPAERVDEVGYQLAGFKAVSHCYERSTTGDWSYNVFAMIHGQSTEEVSEIIAEMEQETGLKHSALLYSTHEFKKKRLTYFTNDYYDWEKQHGA